MDRGFGIAANLKYMLENGSSFVIPGKKGNKCAKSLMSVLVKEKNHTDSLIVHDRHTYSMYTSQVAVVRKTKNDDNESNDTIEYELVLPDDPRFADVPAEMIYTQEVLRYCIIIYYKNNKFNQFWFGTSRNVV